MKPPAGSPTPPPRPPSATPPPKSPSPSAPASPVQSSPPAPNPSPPKWPLQSGPSNPAGTSAPRGEEFDISTLPVPSINGKGNKKLPAEWNRAWAVVVGLLAIYCLWFVAYSMGNHAQKPLPIGPIVTNSAAAPATTVTVHVAGAVVRPGVYSVGANARIADALTQAGGATPDADTTNLNLAALVQDGAQIVVPIRATPAPIAPPPPATAPNIQPAPAGVPSPPTGQLPSPTGTDSPAAAQKAAQTDYLRAHPIDLNQASSFELQQLPGVGPATAQDIIDYRTANGLFRSVSDLDNVKGIGEKRMETLKDLVVVR